ncbi:MAG: GIY-YIG nuclease family protein [Proteobacteria bacterium]|nr:GIY-YIG nuclease family protein [Pseudomonadota bacterium]
MKPFLVYIVRCADGSYYTGHTDDLDRRIAEHQSGAISSCYTFKRRPIELVFSQPCATREEALSSEQQIKGWSRRKKEAMMRGDWSEVSRLARSSTDQAALRQAQGERLDSAQGERLDSAQGERLAGSGAMTTSARPIFCPRWNRAPSK